jgi:protein tyrosine phosphatase (PTP) superfamily phosphohydrolase (DUF442 family)
MRGNLLRVMALLLACAAACVRAAGPVASTNLHNVFRAAPGVLSGSSPAGDAAFAELARLGVRTIISVDGARPDVEAARRHGLRYIHLPFGYDGIPTNRVVELARAAQSAAGPFYVHCHHGRHRGPAAVAVVCQSASGWSTNDAVRFMQTAGTGAEYPGLYRSAAEFRPPSRAALDAVRELPSVTPAPALVGAMVAIDEHFDRLKAAQKTDWRSVPGHPDIRPAHEATLLWEQLRELARTTDTAKRPEDYRTALATAEALAGELRGLLAGPGKTTARAGEVMRDLGKSCAACHQRHRNSEMETANPR